MKLGRKIVLLITIIAGFLSALIISLHIFILLTVNEIRKTSVVIGNSNGPTSVLISEFGASFDFIMIPCLSVTGAGIIYLVLSRNKAKIKD